MFCTNFTTEVRQLPEHDKAKMDLFETVLTDMGTAQTDKETPMKHQCDVNVTTKEKPPLVLLNSGQILLITILFSIMQQDDFLYLQQSLYHQTIIPEHNAFLSY